MKWLAALYAIFLIAIVVATDKQRLPGFIMAIYTFPNGDKVGHFVLLGILTLLVSLSITGRGRNNAGRIALASLIIAGLATLEEMSQILFENRTRSRLDLAASYAGILSFALLAYVMRWVEALRRR